MISLLKSQTSSIALFYGNINSKFPYVKFLNDDENRENHEITIVYVKSNEWNLKLDGGFSMFYIIDSTRLSRNCSMKKSANC